MLKVKFKWLVAYLSEMMSTLSTQVELKHHFAYSFLGMRTALKIDNNSCSRLQSTNRIWESDALRRCFWNDDDVMKDRLFNDWSWSVLTIEWRGWMRINKSWQLNSTASKTICEAHCWFETNSSHNFANMFLKNGMDLEAWFFPSQRHLLTSIRRNHLNPFGI